MCLSLLRRQLLKHKYKFFFSYKPNIGNAVPTQENGIFYIVENQHFANRIAKAIVLRSESYPFASQKLLFQDAKG